MRNLTRGFTLIEMLVVVLIVGILASAALPLAELNLRRAKEAELRQGLRAIRRALDAYRADCLGPQAPGIAASAGAGASAPSGGLIKCENDPTKHSSGYPPNLEVLVSGAEDVTSARGEEGLAGSAKKRYYLRRMPRDPFADPGVPAAQTWGLRSYESSPEAPAPGKDVFDVYSLSDGVGLDGTPYRDW